MVFGSGARGRILELLLLHPHERFYVRQLAGTLGLAVGSVQQEMPRLLKVLVVAREEDGNRVYYRVDRQCPIFPELQRIFLKLGGIAQILREPLRKRAEAIRCAFIFGSVAKGDEEAWSDIDLFVIGDISGRALGGLVWDAQQSLRRPIHHVHYGTAEFRRKLRSRDSFVTSVVRGPKIFLVGNEDELGALAEK